MVFKRANLCLYLYTFDLLVLCAVVTGFLVAIGQWALFLLLLLPPPFSLAASASDVRVLYCTEQVSLPFFLLEWLIGI